MARIGGRRYPNEFWKDMQGIAIWLIIIGIAGYLLFPSYYQNVYSRLTEQAVETSESSDDTILYTEDTNTSTTTDLDDYTTITSIANSLTGQSTEVTTGYWAIFVLDGEFSELSLSNDNYTFLLKLIENDQKATLKNKLILTANGQIQKFLVSDEVFTVISSIAVINERAQEGS